MPDPSRRRFLAHAAALGAAAALPAPLLGRRSAAAYDLVVAGGRLVDPESGISAPMDVAIAGGRVARVAERIAPDEGRQVLDATGRLVTPGLIDAHVHVYDGVAQVGIDADVVGVARGVTTLIDGGSAGATTWPGFQAYVVRPARTRVYALLNISRPGMTVPNETADLGWLDAELAARTVEESGGDIVGIKVRMLAGIPEGQDLEVMRRARAAGDLAGVPVVVHIGGQTSPLPRILDLLRPGDVITHALRREGSILDGAGRVHPEVLEAVGNGVHLDVGHGRGNLDFDVAERVLGQGVTPTTISSDVHRGNAAGPVFDLPTTLSKFMTLGMPLEDVIAAATAAPARIFDLGETLGTLAEGAAADLSVFEVAEGDYTLVDSGGKRRTAARRLVPWACLRDGRPYGALTG